MPVNHFLLEAIDHPALVSAFTPALIHVACSEKVDPTHGWSRLAVIESPMKTRGPCPCGKENG